MKYIGIALAVITLIVLIFFDEVKKIVFSLLALLGLCTSCKKDNPAAQTSPSKQTTASTSSGGGSSTSTDNTNVIWQWQDENYNGSCESYQNHTANFPHLYANSITNELVGTVYSHGQPEFNAYGAWEKMQRVGVNSDDPTRFLYAYRKPFAGNANVKLRTHAGCPEYDDVRVSYPHAYLGRENTLPAIAPISNYANMNLVFNVSSDLTDQTNDVNTYEIQIKGHINNLKARVNGGAWMNTSHETREVYQERDVQFTLVPWFISTKDFWIDFTTNDGQTIERYQVKRNGVGGHFSVTSTFKRVRDGRVFVTTFQGDKLTPMILGSTPSTGWGNFWDLGVLGAGNYTYALKGTTGYVLDPGLYVQI